MESRSPQYEKKVYVAVWSNDIVSVINTKTRTVSIINVEDWPYGIAVTPDGSKAYVSLIR